LEIMSMPRCLAEAMMSLPADERVILVRACHSSWSVERMAQHFDLSPDVVKVRLHDALRRLLAGSVNGRLDTP
jgi:DNA-directed RNA polymerase specialized sigma24 family protein